MWSRRSNKVPRGTCHPCIAALKKRFWHPSWYIRMTSPQSFGCLQSHHPRLPHSVSLLVIIRPVPIMSSESYPVRNSGIYHSLPQFDPSIKDLTAFVTGANGISGFHTLRALLDSPQRWKKIYALSRSPPPKGMMALLTEDQRSRVEHIASDFLKDPKEIADAISKAGVKHVDCAWRPQMATQ